MELRHLKYFITVAEELHFGKAAARLNMAQPPLSLQIRQLEEEIGVPLFHRTKRKVELTKEGQVFLEKAYQILKNLEEAIETVRMMNRGEAGEIAIGFIASAAYDILPTIIEHYRKEYPNIHIDLQQLTTAEQVKALHEGHIDVGMLCHPIKIKNDTIQVEVIRQEPMVVALPKDHPLASETSPIDLMDLSNDPFILTGRKANQSHYDTVMNGCYQAGFYPKVVQETQELPTVISLVSAGMGVALVPASMQYVFKNKVVYRDIQNNPFTTTTALAWKSDNLSPTVHAFIDLMKKSVIPLFNQHDWNDLF
ncbi:Hca operon transcriptional activator [Parageobacillus caldoxylosilyticus]|nr:MULTISPECIES: LysR family transcriptional regulator [Bacillaceae]MEC5186658.1 DNA-binding transcriptional LysR family regulator [Geobacillus thermodenitrificans]QXJ40445.1 Hca operon transcriptional activator [Parageobacillus caldoxylosilyticus]